MIETYQHKRGPAECAERLNNTSTSTNASNGTSPRTSTSTSPRTSTNINTSIGTRSPWPRMAPDCAGDHSFYLYYY